MKCSILALFLAVTSVAAIPAYYPPLQSPPEPLFSYEPVEVQAEPEAPSSEYLPPPPHVPEAVVEVAVHEPVVEPEAPSSGNLPPPHEPEAVVEVVVHAPEVVANVVEHVPVVEPEAPSSEYLPPPHEPAVAAANHQVSDMPMPFNFDWAVKDEDSSNDFGHYAVSDGNTVTGSYRVLLPDGRVQIVTYKADENGYVADVQYQGEATH